MMKDDERNENSYQIRRREIRALASEDMRLAGALPCLVSHDVGGPSLAVKA